MAFLDIDKLEAGTFGDALLKNVKKTKHFVLVLTRGALDRCIEDKRHNVCKDWVHKEIATALEHKLNIIPVVHPDFEWPPDEDLPEDMRNIGSFNGVPWNHYFQKAVVEVIERFIRGAKSQRDVDERDAIIREILVHDQMHNMMMGPPLLLEIMYDEDER